MLLRVLDPALDAEVAAQLLALQRSAYRVEAELIGDARLPPLHEEPSALRAAGLLWVGAVDEQDGALLGAVGWTETEDEVDLHRLAVAPAVQRSGLGRRLVESVLAGAGSRRVVVATGRDNTPARELFTRLGFEHRIDVEVQPGLWVCELARPGVPPH